MNTIQSENPHAYNPYFFSNVTSEPFSSTQFYVVQKLSNYLAFILGLVTNLLVLSMVLWKTPRYFKKFSQILLFSVACDLYFILANIWCQARVKISSGAMLISMSGLATSFSYSIQCHSVVLLSTSELMSYLVLPIQYSYRFYTIKSNTSLSWPQIAAYIFASSIFALLCALITDQAFCSFTNPTGIDFATYWYKEMPVPKLIVGSQYHRPMLLHMLYYGTVCLTCYAIVIFFAQKTMIELKKQTHYLTPKTKALQKQFSRTLLLQCLTPMIVTIIPALLSILALFTQSNNDYVGEYIVMSMSWLPFINSMNVLLLIGPYREQCIQWFLPSSMRQRTELSNSNIVHPRQNSLSVIPTATNLTNSVV